MEPIGRIEGTALPLDRSDVDTDQIIPAEHLKRIERTGFGPFLFEAWRKDPDFILNDTRYAGATILLAGPNFGCGSSREHAPWAIEDHGFKAVIAPSFADIFRNNALKNGLLPVAVDAGTHAALLAQLARQPEAELAIDLAAQALTLPDGRSASFPVEAFSKACLLNGVDELGYILRFEDLGHREKAWGAFQADEARLREFAETERDGPLVARVHNQFWRATNYSPLR